MNNCNNNSGNFMEISENFAVFFCIFDEFGHFWTHLWNSGFVSSKFRREITILMQKLRMFEWIIISRASSLNGNRQEKNTGKRRENIRSKSALSVRNYQLIFNCSFLPKLWRVFCWIFEFWAAQKYVNFVDFEKCWKMTIWLQKSASIQPRMSLSKFGEIE